jgi:predicted nucleic acid-binding protein
LKTLILLDSGVIGVLASPYADRNGAECLNWLEQVKSIGIDVRIPLICYYEIRREFLRLTGDRRLDAISQDRWRSSLRWLDRLVARMGVTKIDSKVMRLATVIWAESRKRGLPMAADESLDVDVILAATARRAERGDRDVWVVTTNVGHLSRFVQACTWSEFPLP